jgi:hypothetical protein
LGDYNYDLTDPVAPAPNNISTIAAFLEDGSDLSYTDTDGFQVAFVDFMRNTTSAVMIPGIQLQGRGIEGTDEFLPGNLNLTTLAGVEFNGIQLTSTGTVVTPGGAVNFRSIKPAN